MAEGVVEKAKVLLDAIIDGDERIEADDILKAVQLSRSAIEILESRCNENYSDGKVSGMEYIVDLLFGKE